MYIACSKGHDKVVQVLVDHGVQMDVQLKVSDIFFILSDVTQQKVIMHKKTNEYKMVLL